MSKFHDILYKEVNRHYATLQVIFERDVFSRVEPLIGFATQSMFICFGRIAMGSCPTCYTTP